MIGDDFLTVEWFTHVTVTTIGVIAILTLLMVAWFIANTPSRTYQPIGNVKSYPPRPVPLRPVLTECAFCDTPIVPGATVTECRNCGAPIRPIASPPPHRDFPPPGPPATVYGIHEPFAPVGESIVRKLSEAITGAMYAPNPMIVTNEQLRKELDDLEKSGGDLRNTIKIRRRAINERLIENVRR